MRLYKCVYSTSTYIHAFVHVYHTHIHCTVYTVCILCMSGKCVKEENQWIKRKLMWLVEWSHTEIYKNKIHTHLLVRVHIECLLFGWYSVKFRYLIYLFQAWKRSAKRLWTVKTEHCIKPKAKAPKQNNNIIKWIVTVTLSTESINNLNSKHMHTRTHTFGCDLCLFHTKCIIS